MSEITLYHNPKCSKSRATKALLEERGAVLNVVEYLDQPLSAAALAELGRHLGKPASQWLRKRESAYGESGLDASSSEPAIYDAMAAHPILMERPIAVRGDRAIIGRPPEDVLELL